MLAALAKMHIPQAAARSEVPLPALDARAQQEKLSRDFASSAGRSFVAPQSRHARFASGISLAPFAVAALFRPA
jgi:hypothetical protein